MLDYKKILKQAFEIIRSQKKLWWFGLFLMFGGVGNLITFRQDDKSSDQQAQRIQEQVNSYFTQHQGLALGVGIILLLFVVLMVVGYYYAKAGTIISVNKIIRKEGWGFMEGMKSGIKYFNRLISISLFCLAVLVIVGVIFGAPIAYLYMAKLYSRATILLILALIIALPVFIVISLVSLIAPLFAVSFNLRFRDSLRASFDIINKQWLNLVVLGFCIMLVTMLGMVIFFIILGLISIPFVVLLSFLYDKVGFLIFFIITVFLLSFALIAILFAQGAVALFSQVAWVVAFNYLVKPIFINEKQAMALENTLET